MPGAPEGTTIDSLGQAVAASLVALGSARVGVSMSDVVTGQGAYAAVLEALIMRGRRAFGSAGFQRIGNATL